MIDTVLVTGFQLLLALHQFHGLHDDGGDVVLVLDDDVEGVRLVAQFLLVMGRFQDGLPFAEDVEAAHQDREERCGQDDRCDDVDARQAQHGQEVFRGLLHGHLEAAGGGGDARLLGLSEPGDEVHGHGQHDGDVSQRQPDGCVVQRQVF